MNGTLLQSPQNNTKPTIIVTGPSQTEAEVSSLSSEMLCSFEEAESRHRMQSMYFIFMQGRIRNTQTNESICFS